MAGMIQQLTHKKEPANVCFSILYFSYNLGQRRMPDIHCGMQNKLPKTMWVIMDTMGDIISYNFSVVRMKLYSCQFCVA